MFTELVELHLPGPTDAPPEVGRAGAASQCVWRERREEAAPVVA